MPLKLNVGVSRKVGLPDYGSVGASCNLEMELDSALLERDLDRFHERVRDAFVAARQAVQDELARVQAPVDFVQPTPAPPAPTNGRGNGNGHPSSGPAQRTRPGKPATDRQVKAILTTPASSMATSRDCSSRTTACTGPRTSRSSRRRS